MAWKTLSQTCPHRNVSDDGRIICKMIGVGDNEVIPLLCRDCPMQAISCDHLRCSLQKIAPTPITVRYVTGRVEILDNEPAQVTFLRAAWDALPPPAPRQFHIIGEETETKHDYL